MIVDSTICSDHVCVCMNLNLDLIMMHFQVWEKDVTSCERLDGGKAELETNPTST